MREELQKKCELFVENKRRMEKTFKWENSQQHFLSAAVFAMQNRKLEPERIKAARNLIRKKNTTFSSFRSYAELSLATFLALEEDPEMALAKTMRIHEHLKKSVWDASFLPVISYLLSKRVEENEMERVNEKAKEIYKEMKKKHPFLTGTEDFNYALLFALSDRSAEGCIREMEGCYEGVVKTFGKQDSTQALSHILGLGEENASYKTARTIKLFEKIREKGLKYPKETAAVMLGALALAISDEQADVAADEVIEVHSWLKAQKGFGGFSIGNGERMMYAALLTADGYTNEQRNGVETALSNSLVSLLIAEITALIAVSTMMMVTTVNSTN